MSAAKDLHRGRERSGREAGVGKAWKAVASLASACSEDLPDEARSAPPDAAAGDHSKSGKLPGTVRGGEHEVARMEVR